MKRKLDEAAPLTPSHERLIQHGKSPWIISYKKGKFLYQSPSPNCYDANDDMKRQTLFLKSITSRTSVEELIDLKKKLQVNWEVTGQVGGQTALERAVSCRNIALTAFLINQKVDSIESLRIFKVHSVDDEGKLIWKQLTQKSISKHCSFLAKYKIDYPTLMDIARFDLISLLLPSQAKKFLLQKRRVIYYEPPTYDYDWFTGFELLQAINENRTKIEGSSGLVQFISLLEELGYPLSKQVFLEQEDLLPPPFICPTPPPLIHD